MSSTARMLPRIALRIAVDDAVDDDVLRELLALFRRYGVASTSLAQFRRPENEGWFARTNAYWFAGSSARPPRRGTTRNGRGRSVNELDRRVAEASAWWQRCARPVTAYRDAPAQALDVEVDLPMEGALKTGQSQGAIDAKRCAMVETVVRRRRALLAGATPNAAAGRVLGFDLSGCFHDGVAQEVSGGFFDENDLPPVDLWLAYRAERTTLYFWVPSALIACVDRALGAHLVDAFKWPNAAELVALRARLGAATGAV